MSLRTPAGFFSRTRKVRSKKAWIEPKDYGLPRATVASAAMYSDIQSISSSSLRMTWPTLLPVCEVRWMTEIFLWSKYLYNFKWG